MEIFILFYALLYSFFLYHLSFLLIYILIKELILYSYKRINTLLLFSKPENEFADISRTTLSILKGRAEGKGEKASNLEYTRYQIMCVFLRYFTFDVMLGWWVDHNVKLTFCVVR